MPKFLRTLAIGAVMLFGGLARAVAAGPSADQNLVLKAPITTWDEAVPLGNGLMGGLLWGEANKIRLSLDRGDLWDERPAGEKEWWKTRTFAKAAELVAKQDFDTVANWWDSPYNGVTPTKLPAGRLEITLDPAQTVERFELNLATAEGIAHFAGGQRLEAFFSAAEPVALMRIPGPEPQAIELIPSGAKPAGGRRGPEQRRRGQPAGLPAGTARPRRHRHMVCPGRRGGPAVLCLCRQPARRCRRHCWPWRSLRRTMPRCAGPARQRCAAALDKGTR